MRRRLPFFTACLFALGVLQLQASNVQPNTEDITVEIEGPQAGMLGQTVKFSASVSDGSAGSGNYTYQWNIDGHDKGTGASQEYTVPDGDQNAKHITVKCTATDKEDASIKGDGVITFWQVRVNLTCNDTVLNQTPRNVRVGEKINLAVQFLPSQYSPTPSYTWTIQGKTVQEYMCTRTYAHYTELPASAMQQQQVTFYWIHGKADGNGLEQQVICRWQSSDCAGCPLSLTGRFTVSAPDIRAAMNGIRFGFGPVNITDNVYDRMFGLWKGNNQTAGYDEMFNYFALNNQGYDAQYAQLIEVSLQESSTLLGNTTWIIVGQLDGNFGTWYWIDTPGTSLPSGLFSCSRHDHFSTYILCKPRNRPDAIWVPAYRHAWYWHGTATKSNDVFVLSESSMDRLQYYGHEIDGFHLELPQWNGCHVE